jgi:hypothetical protein
MHRKKKRLPERCRFFFMEANDMAFNQQRFPLFLPGFIGLLPSSAVSFSPN